MSLRRSGAGVDRHIRLDYKHSMSEEKIVEVVNEALAAAGIEDTVIARASSNPAATPAQGSPEA
jgi:hypothetical protein